TVTEEIVMVGARVGSHNATHLHWGGGTPSLLGIDRITGLVEKVGDVFGLTADCDHAIELDPRYVTPGLAHSLARIGVNRASLGVQDFTPHVQQAIGRIQPFAVVERAVSALREAGIGKINFDLMYGLPQQNVDDVRRSAELAATLAPDRVACFGYAHVPWFKTHQRLIDSSTLPAAHERLKQAAAVHDALLACGYEPIGLDHFARPDDNLAAAARAGHLRRNFQGYTTDDADALIGFGASAIGKFRQGFVQNASDIGGYQRAICSGQLATVRGVALSADDIARGRIIERLMCDLEVDLDSIAIEGTIEAGRAFGEECDALAPFESEGLVQRDGRRIVVTEKGRPFVRLIAAAFDAYLPKEGTHHSAAV
ncbi:MAG TPA: oxygen-independent coproporphyrinogen III oxidase, partial [Burkholderiales bacterium]|nr:oxygen-independent coproporphyrinogen III oxidase [Burkholderiales bacterium]